MIYVVGNEQDYHFKVLKAVLKKLGADFSHWAENIFHLSYGMVDLPSGKMKSREGTVVDADDLIQEVINEAEKKTKVLGKIEDFSSDEAKQLYKTIGLGALKYFILRVDPEKRMLFNPAESIDFNGNTGPFIQYTYARLRSVIRKGESIPALKNFSDFNASKFTSINEKEKSLITHLVNFPFVVFEAGEKLSPSLIAHYAFEAAKLYNQYYHDFTIVDEEQKETSFFRLQLSTLTARIIKSSMHLLGIDVPERM